MYLQRMWINQPSSYQTYHSYHGRNVLAEIKEVTPENKVLVYFVTGDTYSTYVDKNALSDGWTIKNDIQLEEDLVEQLHMVLTGERFHRFYTDEDENSFTAYIVDERTGPTKQKILHQIKNVFANVISKAKEHTHAG